VLEAAAALVFAITLGLGFLWWTQRSMMYFPSTAVLPPAANVLPGAQDVALDTSDGLRLASWFVPARGMPPPWPAVLLAHGNGGDRSDRAPLADALSRAGYAVLLLEYRGYGGNPGSPTEQGLLNDARAGADHLERRHDVDRSRIAYFGESLGAGVVTALATERRPAAVMLRSPFTSFAEVGAHHYPWLPVALFIIDRYPIDEQIRSVNAPVLVIASERDEVVPPRYSRAVYERALEPKRLVMIDALGHNDPELLDGERMLAAVDEFLRAHLGSRSR
jgi:fermentation-respiration switch protein FrsA (DUF1100 family)